MMVKNSYIVSFCFLLVMTSPLVWAQGSSSDLGVNLLPDNPINTYLKQIYPALNTANLKSHVGNWAKQVESELCAEQPQGCEVRYKIELLRDSGADYFIIPYLDEDDFLEFAFSLGTQEKLSFLNLMEQPGVYFDDKGVKYGFASYLTLVNLSELNTDLLRPRKPFLDFLESTVLSYVKNPTKAPRFYSKDTSNFLYEVSSVMAGKLNSQKGANELLKPLTERGFPEESQYVYFLDGIAYQLDQKLELFESLERPEVNAKGNLVTKQGKERVKTVSFNFDGVDEFNGPYLVQKNSDPKRPETSYTLFQVDRGLGKVRSFVLTRKDQVYTLLNRKSVIPAAAMHTELTDFPYLNAVDLQLTPLDEGERNLRASAGKIQKLVVPNINQFSNYLVAYNIKNKFPKIEEIEVPYLIVENYAQVQQFRSWARGIQQSLANEGVRLKVQQSVHFNSGKGHDGEAVYYRSPGQGIPFQAIRLVREKPSRLKLKVVVNLGLNEDKYSKLFDSGLPTFFNEDEELLDRIETVDARVVCLSEGSGQRKLYGSLLVFERTELLEDASRFEATLDVSPLENCNTLNEKNFVLSVQIKQAGGRRVEPKLDWYLQSNKL